MKRNTCTDQMVIITVNDFCKPVVHDFWFWFYSGSCWRFPNEKNGKLSYLLLITHMVTKRVMVGSETSTVV